MRVVVMVLLLPLFLIISTKEVYAVIFLPALILIPLAHLVGLLLIGLSFPLYAIGFVWHLLTKHSLKRTFVAATVLLAVFLLICAVVLKLLFPAMPLI